MRVWVPAVVATAALAGRAAHAACDPAGDVVINEVMVNPSGSDSGFEWVELFNVGEQTVELEGWELEAATTPGAAFSNVMVLLAGVTIAPGQALLVGDLMVSFPGVPVVLVDATGSGFGNNSTAEDALRLVDCAGGVRDVLVYGDAAQHDTDASKPYFVDEQGRDVTVDRMAPAASEGRSFARPEDGVDTDTCVDDFIVVSPTPGRSNTDTSVPVDPGGGVCVNAGRPRDVVINEALPAPGRLANEDGTDSGYEWVELYNPTAAAVDVSGWELQQAGQPDDWGARVRFVLPLRTSIAPGAHLVVSDALAAMPASATVLRLESGSLGLGNSQDGLRLVDCGGAVVDQLVYGGANPDAFLDEAGALITAETVAPAVKDDLALARRADGLDSDDCGADFALTEPTPGAPNADLSCRASDGEVRINELLPNPDGSDSTNQVEFVELFNAGSEPVDISTWTLRQATNLEDDGSLVPDVIYAVPPGTVIAPGGFFVVAGVMFDGEADDYAEDFGLSSGTSGDLLALYACDGARVDGVVFGGSNVDRLREDDGQVPETGAPYPSEDACVARRVDGEDTDESRVDFTLSRYCSPGASNVREGFIQDPGPTGGCGGAGGPRDVGTRDLAERGCSQSRGDAAVGVALLGLVLRRRSRAR